MYERFPTTKGLVGLVEYLVAAFPLTSKLRVLVIRCCKSIITKPTPNSAAEKIKKKKDKDKMLRLSNARPIIKTNPYKVIHNNSAVKRRCSEVLGFVNNVLNRNKNRVKKTFISPRNKIKITGLMYKKLTF